jgi:hypothetical protein
MIPRIIHFIWIYAGAHPTEEHIFSIKTAVVNTTCRVILHTDDKTIKPIPGVEIRHRIFDKDIKGIPFDTDEKIVYKGEAKRVAHISDIVRCQILYEEGGIYSDMDVFWLRNPIEFWDKKVVIGFTNQAYKILANSVLMAQPKQKAIKDYYNWLVDIYPCKKYWVPANPYKIWQNDKSVTMVKKHYWFPVGWDKIKDLKMQDVEKSIAIHVFCSMGGNTKGELYSSLKKDILRYEPCVKKNKTLKKRKLTKLRDPLLSSQNTQTDSS